MANIHHSAASLRIIGDTLIPDEISEVLGSAPTKSHVKGEHLRTTKSGEMKFAKFGMWNLKASRAEPENINHQINEILTKLTTDIPIWLALSKKYKIELFCGLFMQTENDGLSISPLILTEIGSRNIELSFDIYSS